MDENEAETQRVRKLRDAFFRSHPESPLDPEERAKFSGLRYFPYDPKYLVTVRFVPYPNPETVSLATSKGIGQKYLRLGYFEFAIDGKTFQLQAYRSPHGTHSEGYFVPFRDSTSGNESYVNTRYLEVEEKSRIEGDMFKLDFNLAYNPYCAYTDKYACPFPPAENTLSIPIRAGEKKYKES